MYLIIKSQIYSTNCFDFKENGVIVVSYGLLILAEFHTGFFSLHKATASFKT
ncbi:hypothetical protein CY34DRAFT_803984 [Suillus luteus UH-Slu-Lm8-n1]|uniref:Uncharacterized protein n=1 Tax=Suillus luteus UH-Slu-Lm8-n1 TaxID=930992 RepID=A0A0D0AN92_9AGAM|nr:hypothetical protein CY34DRAFT_803984 [Suillus luteus UH-Slu-Lm8-n1]